MKKSIYTLLFLLIMGSCFAQTQIEAKELTKKEIKALKRQKAFEKQNIPFREFRIKSIKEEVIGEFFALFIVETIIIGKLLNINPFDQPAVEQVKIYTKKFLS